MRAFLTQLIGLAVVPFKTPHMETGSRDVPALCELVATQDRTLSNVPRASAAPKPKAFQSIWLEFF